MVQCGEMVLYGTDVCRVEGRERLKVGAVREDYYILKPVYRPSATIYVPAGNEQLVARMRRVLSIQEIESILGDVAQDEVAWVDDPNERREAYGKILTGGDRCVLMRMIRTLYQRRQQLRTMGKQLRTGDDQILRDAERLLHDEFAFVLQIPQTDVPDYIRGRIGTET